MQAIDVLIVDVTNLTSLVDTARITRTSFRRSLHIDVIDTGIGVPPLAQKFDSRCWARGREMWCSSEC